MKSIFTFLLFFLSLPSWAQDFSRIDERAREVEAPTPDSLAHALTGIYTDDLSKARAVYSWIAQHISYNTGIYRTGRSMPPRRNMPDPFDTLTVWRPGMEMAAWQVMLRRVAVCEGYAKLFKVLCDYSGLEATVVTGYAKCFVERGDRFRTNHTWNAVRINGSWYLLDVTWASGYINYADEYVARLDDRYFLSPPRSFIRDHYPEDPRWTLMPEPPALKEFDLSPFRFKSFVKYGIRSFSPGCGTLEAAVGDTLHMELDVRDTAKDKSISSDPFFDSTVLTASPRSVFLEPAFAAHKAVYTYVVGDEPVEWLNLMYNNDLVLRYRLRRK